MQESYPPARDKAAKSRFTHATPGEAREVLERLQERFPDLSYDEWVIARYGMRFLPVHPRDLRSHKDEG